MSQFNQSQLESQEKDDRKKSPIIYWVVILALLIGCIFLFMSKNKMAEETAAYKQQMEAQLDSVKSDRASLQSDFDAASAKIDQLVSENAQLDSNLKKDQAELLDLKNKIASLLKNKKATAKELAQAREMINSLTDKTKAYEARIAELEKENAVLTNKNTVLTKERDSTVTQNIAIKKLGSVLHVSNLRLEPMHVKRNGKEKETSKARKVNVFRFKFDIDENRIAESGTKQLFLRIVGPDGNVLSNALNGSARINTVKGDNINYSIMKEVALVKEQPIKDVTVDWKQDGDYQKGNYSIEVYNDGYKIGAGNVTLK